MGPGREVDQLKVDDSESLEIPPRSVLNVKQLPYEAVEYDQNTLKDIVINIRARLLALFFIVILG